MVTEATLPPLPRVDDEARPDPGLPPDPLTDPRVLDFLRILGRIACRQARDAARMEEVSHNNPPKCKFTGDFRPAPPIPSAPSAPSAPCTTP